jgi:putative ABC transport system ATP-binding protein
MRITLEQVSKTYKRGELDIPVLRDVTAGIEYGEFVFIVGPSGSGKSTLLYLLGGMDQPTSGRVLLNDVDMARMDARELERHRREDVGFIFQNFNLLSNLNALDNVLVPIMPRGVTAKSRASAQELLVSVGLGHRLHHHPNHLSGGEQQRVAIARALFKQPKLVLADEPTGELDSKTGLEVFGHLRRLHQEHHATVIVVTHDKRYITDSDRVLEISDGMMKL